MSRQWKELALWWPHSDLDTIFFALFFQTFYFFSLNNVGMLIVTSDPPYADMTQFHQLNIQKILLGTVFLFYL
jgi:hypothetical protein